MEAHIDRLVSIFFLCGIKNPDVYELDGKRTSILEGHFDVDLISWDRVVCTGGNNILIQPVSGLLIFLFDGERVLGVAGEGPEEDVGGDGEDDKSEEYGPKDRRYTF